MRDKRGQQRRWRADGAIRSIVDRRPVGEDPALASSSAFAATRRTAARLRPQGARRHFVDSAQRRSLAGFARRVPLAGHVLAQTARLGRARCLAQYLAGVSGRTQRTETVAVERVFFGREFCSRQKRGAGVGKTKRGKGTKWMVVVDGQGLPLGKHLCSASPHEARLAETTLATIRVSRRTHAGRPRQKPLRLIADRGYDSDPLRTRLAARGIELIAPHRWNRSKPVTQVGRSLRRFRRRWEVERTFARIGNVRHLVVRYDRTLKIFSTIFHIARFIIV